MALIERYIVTEPQFGPQATIYKDPYEEDLCDPIKIANGNKALQARYEEIQMMKQKHKVINAVLELELPQK